MNASCMGEFNPALSRMSSWLIRKGGVISRTPSTRATSYVAYASVTRPLNKKPLCHLHKGCHNSYLLSLRWHYPVLLRSYPYKKYGRASKDSCEAVHESNTAKQKSGSSGNPFGTNRTLRPYRRPPRTLYRYFKLLYKKRQLFL